MFQGIAASPGIALGRVFLLDKPNREIVKIFISESQITSEHKRFAEALNKSVKQLTEVIQTLNQRGAIQEAGILEGQLYLLTDPQLTEDVNRTIASEHVDAAWAVHEVFEQYVQVFETMEDEYLKERAADMRDVQYRVIDELLDCSHVSLEDLQEPVIIIAHDLTPSMTVQLDKHKVIGFATDIGSKISHTSIMARTLGIPAVVGCLHLTGSVKSGEYVIVDGQQGVVVISPSEAEIETYKQTIADYEASQRQLEQLKDKKAKTKDGKEIELLANIGNSSEIEAVHRYGGEGVGLFRSEFLFMDRDTKPSEEEQFAVYKETVEKLGGKPLIIRTLDVGGDKDIPYLVIGTELNPFLGWRAIRYCLGNQGLFKTQLRAILRASSYGDIRIMFPMISGVEELLKAKDMLEEAKEELRTGGHSFNLDLPVGIMIEIPAAAVISDRLAPYVDFFSIGTNDLIQYTIAVDRMNEKVSYLYDPEHLAILRLIDTVCKNAKKCGKRVGMCGEMAGDPKFTKLLIGLGVDEWSMSPAQIPKVKQEILQLSEQECVEWIQTHL